MICRLIDTQHGVGKAASRHAFKPAPVPESTGGLIISTGAQETQMPEVDVRIFAECPECGREVDKYRRKHYAAGKFCPGVPILVEWVRRTP